MRRRLITFRRGDLPRAETFESALSPLQERILAALPRAPQERIPTSLILERLGISKPTDLDRTTVARSLARLSKRGLVQAWHPELPRQGRGYVWSRVQRP